MAARKKTAKKKATRKKGSSPGFEFVVGMLRKNPKVDYATVQAAATRKGYKIYPIVYGRAKKLLGMTGPPKKKAPAVHKTTARTLASQPAIRRGPGRPRKNAMDSLETAIEVMKRGERDRERFRKALSQIQNIIEGAM